MGEFKDFIKSRTFLLNLAGAIVLLVIVATATSKYLDVFTRHGKFIVLPDLNKKPLADVEVLLKNEGLQYIIIDSTYDEKLPPRTVINQIPYVGAHVKSGRNIYLYITTAVAPMVEIPASGVIDASFASAKLLLEREGLKISTDVQSEVNICVGCVLKVIYKGKVLSPGDKLAKGSRVQVVLGRDANSPADRN
jgi:beta-lactam-binding protein with PASTA domain